MSRFVSKKASCRYGCKVMALSAFGLLMMGTACSRRPDDVMSPKDMVSLLSDLYIAEAYASSSPAYATDDSMKIVLRQGVLADHKTNEKNFTRSLDWYGHNIDELGEIYEDVEAQLEQETKSPTEKKVGGSKSSDKEKENGNLWEEVTRVSISPRTNTDRVSFEIDGSKIKKGNNQLVWEFSTPYLPGRISAFIGADYTDGTFNHSSRTYTSAGPAQIIFDLLPDKNVKRVFGQVTYTPVNRETVFVDSLRLISRPGISNSNVGGVPMDHP